MTNGKRLPATFLALALLSGFTGCMSAAYAAAASPVQEETGTHLTAGGQNLESMLVPVEASLLQDWDSTFSESFREENSAVRFTVAHNTPSLISGLKTAVKRNTDVVGWLQIPDTAIDTAIVQNPRYETNDYYLQHDFYGVESKSGTYCADQRNVFAKPTRNGLSTNTVLYAHSFDDDPESQLFSQLKKYRDTDFARTHPYIYFSTAMEDMVWEVFAVFETTVHMPYVWPELPEDIAPQVMETVYSASLYDYGIKVTKDDKILTLSTCTYYVNGVSLPRDVSNDYRFVVMARLVDSSDTWKTEASLKVRANPVGPDQQAAIDLSWIDEWV